MKFKYEDLQVWQVSLQLVEHIYQITSHFPKEELFVLTSQIRRAAISITLNIAEGSTRQSQKDFIRFIRISIGSVVEVDAALKIAIERNYIKTKDYQEIEPLIQELYFKLIGLEKSLKK